MSIFDLNDALQRATRDGNWVYWHPRFDGSNRTADDVYLADAHASVRLGSADDGLDALLARIPDAETALDAV